MAIDGMIMREIVAATLQEGILTDNKVGNAVPTRTFKTSNSCANMSEIFQCFCSL